MIFGRHILSALDGLEVTPLIEKLILKEKIFGFTLFKRNIKNADQVLELNKELKALAKQAGYEIVLAVDQEGGRVARLLEPEFTKIPPMRNWAEQCQKNRNITPVYELGGILAKELSAVGFNLNFAPTVDIDLNSSNPIIGDRSFSSSAEIVYELAKEFIRGMIDQNVVPCLKHFPGHGATSKDSHLEMTKDSRLWAEIEKTDIQVYKKLIDDNLAPTIMTAHVVYTELDSKSPATLSSYWLNQILRQQLKYTAVLFSDDLLMKAIADHYSLFEATKKFLMCGGDVVLICEHPEYTQDLIDNMNGFLKNSSANKEAIQLENMLYQSKIRIQKLSDQFLSPKLQGQTKQLSELVTEHRKFIDKIFAV